MKLAPIFTFLRFFKNYLLLFFVALDFCFVFIVLLLFFVLLVCLFGGEGFGAED